MVGICDVSLMFRVAVGVKGCYGWVSGGRRKRNEYIGWEVVFLGRDYKGVYLDSFNTCGLEEED